MIELTDSLSVDAGEDGEEVDLGGTNTAGRIGPSKMSAHSLTFSLLGDPGDFAAVDLIRGGDCGSGTAVDEMICACLVIEDEWVPRLMMEGVRCMVQKDVGGE